MQKTSSPSFQPLWLEMACLLVYFTIIRSAPPSPVSVKTLNVQASVLFNAMVNTIKHVSLVFTVGGGGGGGEKIKVLLKCVQDEEQC